MRRIRIAVVGVGHLGRIHARLLSQSSQFELCAVVDPLEPSRRALADELNVDAYAHAAELTGRVDAAVVSTPTCFHHTTGAALARSGIHLLVEKPLAASADEAHDLVTVAHDHQVVLQVGHVERFNPAWSSALPYIRDAKYIEAVRRGGFTFRSTDIGVVLDLMIHDLDLVLSLARSPVRRIDALGLSIFGRHEDIANARLVFDNGCVATFSVSRASYTPARLMQIWSPHAYASVDFSAPAATLVEPSDAVRSRSLDVERLSPDARQRLKETLLAEHLPQRQLRCLPINAIAAEHEDFAASIREGRQPRASGQSAAEAVELAERILEAIAEHSWNGSRPGPVGPRAVVPPPIVPPPHWHRTGEPTAAPRREAG